MSASPPSSVATPAPPAITLVVGPEDLLAERAVRAVTRAARELDPGADVRTLAAQGLEIGVVSELLSPSLFGERKVVVIEGVQDSSEELVTELRGLVGDLPDDTHLVLVHRGGNARKALLDDARKAKAHEVACATLKRPQDKLAFVRAEFAGLGRRATPDAMRALVDALGENLRELANAVSQLAADTEGQVGVDDVARYYGGRVEARGFDVADAAVEGRGGEALRLLRHALATGVHPLVVTAALAGGLRSLAKVSGAGRGARSADVARELGMAPFMIDKARRQLAGWSPDGVAAAITAVARADAEIKGAGADPAYALERAIATIVAARA